MKYTKNIKNMGISEKDFKILKILNNLKQTKILPLEKELKIPRTTISFRLRRLAERNLVERVKTKNHFEWRNTDCTKNLFLEELKNKDFEVSYYHGFKNIEKIIEKILKNKSEERVYFIEPYNQTKEFIGKEKQKTILNISKIFKKGKNISEGITSDKNLNLIKNYDKKTLESMVGRMTIIYTIPDQYLSFEEMILVYKNSIYTFNFKKELVTEIKSQSFAKSMKSIILALQSFGHKIDLNKYIKDFIKIKIS